MPYGKAISKIGGRSAGFRRLPRRGARPERGGGATPGGRRSHRLASPLHGPFHRQLLGHKGNGQPVDFIATDILRVRHGRITDNWHLEDNLTFLQQIGVVTQ